MKVAGATHKEIARRLGVSKDMIRIEVIRAVQRKRRSWATHHFVTDAAAARYLIEVLRKLETTCAQSD
jgi:DNA-binding transcriptional regulator LsrR (DeoR family)